ncbi:MAG: single-stranded DNA-binding protein [Frankiales bacterium]|nr:single-stranded DNA-binding protein [Frankiales bacterium]
MTSRRGSGSVRASGEDDAGALNEVRLRGRLAAAPEEREMPSGDRYVVFRLVVDRPAAARSSAGSARFDTLQCTAFRAEARRRLLRWERHDVVEVRGSLRRWFFHRGADSGSRYQVEVESAARVTRAGQEGRATMAG